MIKNNIIYFIYINLLFLINFSFCEIKQCENEGIQLSNNSKCIFPEKYYLNNDKCTQAQDILGYNGSMDINTVCCWSKYRKEMNLKEMMLTTGENENKSNDNKIRKIFETYGPWDKKDIKMANYLIESDEKGLLNMKYSKEIYNIVKSNEEDINCKDLNNPNPLAFSFFLHKNLDNAVSLIDLLYKPYHYYVIHIDHSFYDENILNEFSYKINQIIETFKLNNTKWGNYPNNIKIMKNRFKSIWGSISLVYMELASYTELFEMVLERRNYLKENSQTHFNNNNNIQWSHVINLSGNDMPVKSITEISNILCENKNTNYLEEKDIKELMRFSVTWYEKTEWYQIFPLSNENFTKYDCGDNGLLNYYNKSNVLDGTQWHILTSHYAHYLISNPRSLERLYSLKFAFVPDETFFQASKLFYPNLNDGKTKFKFDQERLTMWNNNIHGNENERYSVELQDLENLSNNTFFVRKVYREEIREKIINKFNLKNN